MARSGRRRGAINSPTYTRMPVMGAPPQGCPVGNRADPCHICYVTKQSPHPYYLKIRPCNAHVDRHRWEILDNEGLLQTSADSFATEREAKDNGRLEMQGLIEIWNKK